MNKRISIFNNKTEFLNLILPLPILLIAFNQIFQITSYFNLNTSSAEFLSDYIFLNRAHVMFTFILILLVDDFRKYIVACNKKEKLNLWLQWLAILLMFWFYFAIISPSLISNGKVFFEQVLTAAIKIIATYHNLAQTVGLSSLYNKECEMTLNSTDKQLFYKSAAVKYERKLLYLSMAICVSYQIFILFFDLSKTYIFFPIIPFILLFLNLYLVFSNQYLQKTNKGFYLLRTLLLPLSFFSYVAFFGFRAMHGIEYFFIFFKITKNSNIKFSFSNTLYLKIIALIVLGYIFFNLPRDPFKNYLFSNFKILNSDFNFLFILALAFTYLHYYLDGVLFRMRKEENKAIIGPLLLNK